MKSTVRTTLSLFPLIALILAACAPQVAPTAVSVMQVPIEATAAPLYNAAPEASSALAPDQAKTAADGATVSSGSSMPGSGVIVQTGAESQTGAQTGIRMVIKNAEMRLLVEQTDNAIDRALQTVGDVGGYIISSRAWYQAGPDGQNYKYATLTMGVPVDQFENAMRRLRSSALRVLDENASGQDVSDEYVDLQSQLGNLEATRDRIRSFLDNAQSVEESLRINQELSNIEAQIEQVKGRMNYLSNRSAFSTITVTFEPDIPPLTPTPTLTPEPTATPQAWNPGATFHTASQSAVSTYQALTELAIWLFIFVIPLLAPPALLIWGIYRLVNRKKNKPASGG